MLISLVYALLITDVVWSEPRYVPEGDDVLQLKVGITTPGLDYTLKGPGPDITFVPNTPSNLFVAGSYRNLALGVQLPPGKQPSERVHTDITDYQLRFFGHRSTHELIYQRFKGYELQGWTANGRPVQRPQMSVRFVGVNFFRSLSPDNFSQAIALDQRGVQHTGGGAVFIWTSAGETRIEDSEPLVPSFSRSTSGDIGNLDRFKMYSLQLGTGYGYQQPVLTRGYVTGALFLGAGMSHQEIGLYGGTDSEWAPVSRLGVRIGFGYNYGDHLGGVQLIVDSNNATVKDGEVSQATFTSRIFYGHRINDVSLPWLDRWMPM